MGGLTARILLVPLALLMAVGAIGEAAAAATPDVPRVVQARKRRLRFDCRGSPHLSVSLVTDGSIHLAGPLGIRYSNGPGSPAISSALFMPSAGEPCACSRLPASSVCAVSLGVSNRHTA